VWWGQSVYPWQQHSLVLVHVRIYPICSVSAPMHFEAVQQTCEDPIEFDQLLQLSIIYLT